MSVLRSSELVGRVVGSRYRLLRPVGSGASAHVYVAEDVRLKRRIALKVLHPALAQDRSFQRRFQAEAQTVAGLRHPGIVRVYDWGEDQGEAFLAMELLEGGSLRGLLDRGYKLTISQAAALGLDVAAALAYAHARGLVHRDIKPANLLFDEEGHASVADFGIARALAEASWTEPVGALVGTARYAAPEQLNGVALDGRADVYALALVLVEAVTGEVPFSLDTTLGALMARASRPIPVPVELGLLQSVLERAGAAVPEQRLTAESVAEEIAAVARRLKAPAPLSLRRLPLALTGEAGEPTDLGANRRGAEDRSRNDRGGNDRGGNDRGGNDRRANDRGGNDRGGSRRKPVDPGLTILVGDLPPVIQEEPRAPATGAATTAPATTGTATPAPAAAAIAGPATPVPVAADDRRPPAATAPHRRRRRWPRRLGFAVVVLLFAAAGAGVGLYLTRPAPPPPPPPTYGVPTLSGDSLVTATSALAKEHLTIVVSARQWSPTAAKGRVIAQYPAPGARLLAKQKVSVTLSLGPQPVVVPSLATLDLAQARSFLKADGLRMGTVTRQTSMTVPAGIIISSSGQGHRQLPGTPVNVVLSVGKPMATVPAAAAGMSFTHLEADLEAAGLRVAEYRYYSNSIAAGVVISTEPGPGTSQVVGTTVTVNVSLGPHVVTIPSSIVGLSPEAAAKVLGALGLYVYKTVGSPLENVTATQPPVGSPVLYGKSIVLVTG
jgi:eukaryotic-like serine/threonine-protein kinase